MSDTPLYELIEVGKQVSGPAERLTILKRIDLRVEPGESVAIIGASGSGKTTLLHLLGTLDTPSWGAVRFSGHDLGGLDSVERAKLRNKDIGFVFQFHHLLPEFSTLENVAMPATIAGRPRDEALGAASEALEMTGLADRAAHNVTTLSGGERQRAAVARAVLMRPRVLLADEPSGSLDEASGRKVADMMLELNRELDMTLIVVTHNRELASRMDRVLELSAGVLHAVQ